MAWAKKKPQKFKHDYKPTHPLKDGFVRADFRELSTFELNTQVPDDLDPLLKHHFIDQQIPPNVWKLNEKKVQIEGFIYPLELNGYKIKTGILVPDPAGCCYNRLPMVHELVYFEIEGEGSECSSFKLTVAWGTLAMGDMVYNKTEKGSIYALKVSDLENVD
jgi:hypothetical protein